jgi:hypothetical protein
MERNGLQLPSPEANAALFWQQKYFELLVHTSQVITELSKPLLQQLAVQGVFGAAIQAAQAQSPTPAPEKSAAGQSAAKNDAAVNSAKGN